MKDFFHKLNISHHWSDIRLVLVLLSVVSVPVVVSFFFRSDLNTSIPISAKSLDQLSLDFKKQGIQSFLKSKKSLRKRVSSQIGNSQDPAAQLAATNIAVYLFPDLLPNDSFEKTIAEDSFTPLQNAIEQKPGTPEAQVLFEELRSRVWNYENPRNSADGLSEYADQMLKIYGTLVWK
jgi:hypothetical protein